MEVLFYNIIAPVVDVALKMPDMIELTWRSEKNVCLWLSRDVWLGKGPSGVGSILASDFILSTGVWQDSIFFRVITVYF